MKIAALALLACSVGASPSVQQRDYGSNIWSKILSLVSPFLEEGSLSTSGPFAPVTPEILKSYIEPVNVRTCYIFDAYLELTRPSLGTTPPQQLRHPQRQQFLPWWQTMDSFRCQRLLARPG